MVYRSSNPLETKDQQYEAPNDEQRQVRFTSWKPKTTAPRPPVVAPEKKEQVSKNYTQCVKEHEVLSYAQKLIQGTSQPSAEPLQESPRSEMSAAQNTELSHKNVLNGASVDEAKNSEMQEYIPDRIHITDFFKNDRPCKKIVIQFSTEKYDFHKLPLELPRRGDLRHMRPQERGSLYHDIRIFIENITKKNQKFLHDVKIKWESEARMNELHEYLNLHYELKKYVTRVGERFSENNTLECNILMITILINNTEQLKSTLSTYKEHPILKEADANYNDPCYIYGLAFMISIL